MSRRPIVIAIFALLAAALLVPIVLLLTAGPAAEAPRTPAGASGAAAGAPAAGALRPEDVGWVYAPWMFAQPRPSYALQAGTLADPGPVIDIDVAWAVDHAVDLAREPAFGPLIDGVVVYVADDGNRSAVRRIEVRAGGADERIAELPEIVWAMAVAKDGGHAYLALVDRDDHTLDRGVARLALDGSGDLEVVMPPGARQAAVPDFRLAAVLPFDVDLLLSADGRQLVRRTCSAVPPGCEIDVLELASGAIRAFGEREVTGAAGGMLLSQRCNQLNCWQELLDVASGESHELAAVGVEASIVVVGGRAAVVLVEVAADGGVALRAIDPESGRVTDLLRPPRGSNVTLAGVHGVGTKVSVPDGHVLVGVADVVDGAAGEFQILAIALDGGASVRLPPVPIRHVEPFTQG